MNKKLLILSAISSFGVTLAQVGINNNTPQATLDVTGAPTTITAMDGIIAPRITGVQLRAKTYTNAQNGSLVYVTTADTAPAGQTVNVTNYGYYYFDATLGTSGQWIKVGTGAGGDTTQDVWKDVVADGTITSGPQSLGGPARTETNTKTDGALLDNFSKAVFTDTGRLGIGTVNPTGNLHVYGSNTVYIDKVGNGATLFLRKSRVGSTNSGPLAPVQGTGLGQFIMSAYTGETTTNMGGWNENAGTSIQSYATEAWGSNNAGAGFRFMVSPNGSNPSGTPPSAGQGWRKTAMVLDQSGKVVVSNQFTDVPTTPTGLTGRFTIQDTTSDALYINAPLTDMSTLTTGKLMVWDSAGATVNADTTANTYNTVNTGKVGVIPTTSLVNITTSASPSAGNPVTQTVGGGDLYIKDAGKGIILQSPGGKFFEITISDSGQINAKQIATP